MATNDASSASSSTLAPLEASIFQRLQPKSYLEHFVKDGVRPDGRALNERRVPVVNRGSISTADGSALVSLGGTTVVCGIKAEIAEPELMSPDRGFIVPNVDLSPICSARFRPGAPSDEAQVLAHRLRDILLSSDIVSLASLMIESGRAAWVLYIDVVCMNDDGNFLDAAVLAVSNALHDVRLPKVVYDSETGECTAHPNDRIPLTVTSYLHSMSFGLFDRQFVIADPSLFEGGLCSGFVTIVLDSKGKLRNVSVVGMANFKGTSPLAECISMAREHVKDCKR